jgi:uroporphyrinogen decarboxylase
MERATALSIAEYAFPGPDELVDASGVTKRLETIRSMDEEYAIVGRAVASYGLFEMAQALRRPELLLMDLATNPTFVQTLIERLYDCYTALIERFLEVAGEHLDIIELPGDDFAGNTGLLISPKMFDEYFKDPYHRLVTLIKTCCPHIKVVYHSDGVITDLLPRLVEIGIDVAHSMEPLPGWDLAEVKQSCGDHLAFMGGIDIREALQSDEAAIEAEVKTRLRELGSGGGYVLAPANHLQWDIPPKNLFTLYEAARKYGKYPLDL